MKNYLLPVLYHSKNKLPVHKINDLGARAARGALRDRGYGHESHTNAEKSPAFAQKDKSAPSFGADLSRCRLEGVTCAVLPCARTWVYPIYRLLPLVPVFYDRLPLCHGHEPSSLPASARHVGPLSR